VLVISHDLPLLDKSIDRVLALRDGQLREYKGNYTKFLEQEETRRLTEEKMAMHQDEQIDRMKTLADSMRGQTAARARLAKVLDRKVGKLEIVASRSLRRRRRSPSGCRRLHAAVTCRWRCRTWPCATDR